MLRLTVVSQTKEEVFLKVEGRVSGEDVAVLEEESDRLLRGSECLVLDLQGVNFIDRDGISFLKRYSGDRLILRGGSAFLSALFEEHGLA